jgi:hypothetical protein
MPYRTRHGRRIQLARAATNGLQHLVQLDGTVATFECQAGHRMTHDYGKGPRPRRIPAEALKMMARYWGLGLQANGTRGHCVGWCQRCQNERDKADGQIERWV